MIAGWEALGGFVACFVAGGMVVAARTAWRNRWRRGLGRTSFTGSSFVESRNSFWRRGRSDECVVVEDRKAIWRSKADGGL